MFEVRATDKEGGDVFVLRRFSCEKKAAAHALTVDMKVWDDVWIAPAPDKPLVVIEKPPFPWNVEWRRNYAYVVDANGQRIMALLGPQWKRELVAEILCSLSDPS
jgi:hypothetical protein